ncbi:MAG TPA: SGNH/GDSL hydrolase family protein [Solirubrobacterales bacterium]|nr:SGNH/GDSL hydrolase family protein [Solirubrobacterales bacterium]
MKSRVTAILCVAAACFVFVAPAWATKYVALGDSYSSGTGTRTYYDSNCQRSVYAYPYLLLNAHPSWTFVHAACSGAKTGDILTSQISSVTPDTDWVTYTIGGNDAGFSSVITTCAEPSWLGDCNTAVNNAQSYIQKTLPGRLDLLNNAIRSHAPSAQVIVLDYPHLFNRQDCNAGTFFSSSEETRLNQTADMLKGVLSAAASRAGTNFLFRDVIPPFIGHAVCDGGGGSSTEWINGLSNPVGESYHPKKTGQAGGYYPVVHNTTG